MNDCLHKIYNYEQVTEIYSRFRYVDNISDLKEEIDWSNSDNLEETCQELNEQIEEIIQDDYYKTIDVDPEAERIYTIS